MTYNKNKCLLFPQQGEESVHAPENFRQSIGIIAYFQVLVLLQAHLITESLRIGRTTAK